MNAIEKPGGVPVSETNQPFAETFSGVMVAPFIFEMSDDLVDDMLRGLAYTARFAGQTSSFFSVAQHSVMASYLAEDMAVERNLDPLEMARQALLHDAEEFLLGDMIRPVKYGAPGYFDMALSFQQLGDQIRKEVLRHHGLPVDLHPLIKEVDNMMCACEKRDLKPHSRMFWPNMPEPDPDLIINPLGPEDALASINARYAQLFG